MIRFEHVTKVYPRSSRPALRDISLEVGRGEFVFVVGESGSGKSTLLRLALREEQATQGNVLVAGHELGRLPHRKVPRLRREIGTVFQDFRLLPNKTVRENVAFALEVTGAPLGEIRHRVPRLLALVGLEGQSEQLPAQLSGGEQQRAAIARALVHDPAILIADEPTGNLDPVTGWEIVQLLLEINALGTTLVMATHNQEIVTALRRRVVALEDGKIVRDEVGAAYRRG